MIIVTASGKGGVGKTTTASLLYMSAIKQNLPVDVMNVDVQKSIVKWLGEDVVMHRPDLSSSEQILALHNEDRILIIDTPPGTAPQALSAWESADILIGCSGANTMELEGLADLSERINGLDQIDFVAITRFDSRTNLAHGVLNSARNRWGASRVIVYPMRSEVFNAYDQRREVAISSPVSVASDDLLSRILELPIAERFRR